MNDTQIRNSLNSLVPIGLDSITSVRLMNRIEIKYVFPANKIGDLINLLDSKYKVLEINKLRAFPYLTTYMDTPDFLFYNQHLRGEFGRYKIRYRKYESMDSSYLEIKMKTNKRRTIKSRIENNLVSGTFDDQAVNFISKHLPVNSTLIKPVLINRFTRITLIGLDLKERITIDYNISFEELTRGGQAEMPYLAIVELKKKGQSPSSDFKKLIKLLNIYPPGFSKYCIGSASLNDLLKKNMLKPKLLLLNKIENEYNKFISN
ncbi:MAG TPA: polyphosphate polymerase domain-containing protein [Bacteroidales bacterium]|nr:polyphosphate polymerase domain-containing protein [Bacteroidales bacterium]